MANKNNQTLTQKKPSFVSEPPKKAKAEGQPLRISGNVQRFLPWCYGLLFAVLAAYYLIAENSDTLYMADNTNLFQYGTEYFCQCMRYPGALMYWAGTYLTQYFYYPTLGACMLIALWLIIFAVTKFAFRMKNVWTILAIIPLVCLLCTDIFQGYWIYYIKHDGYMFSTSIGLLAVMLATLVARLLPEKVKIAWLIAWGFAGYVFFGWLSLVGIVYMTVNYIVNEENKQLNKWIIPALGAALVIVVPIICYQFYSTIRIEDAWIAALPLFWASDDFTMSKEIPFIIMAVAPLTFAFVGERNEDKDIHGNEAWCSIFAVIAVAAVSVYSAKTLNFSDYNYHAEMRMYKAIEEQRWNDALMEMRDIPGDATRQMVLMKNIAVLNMGNAGYNLFRYNNMGQPPYANDSLKIHLVQTGAPLIYYNHGKTNFAYRWCIENSVENGFKVRDLKILTLCTLVSKEWDVAKKYIDILKNTTFHKEWAEHFEPIVSKPELMSEYHEFDYVREVYDHMGTTLDGDNGLCEMYLLNYFSNTMNKDSKLLQEITLAYSLIQKDIQLFWPRFFLYANLHKGEDMPIHYQEAAYLYGVLEPGNVDIRQFPFNKEQVIDRYASFTMTSEKLMQQQKMATGQIDTHAIGEQMKALYGDTFYWFYFFCRDVKSY